MKVRFLQAFNGDSIHINFRDKDSQSRNILIDGGTKNAYTHARKNKPGDLKLTIENLRRLNEKIDLLVMTHIDDDHIGGILKWFSKDSDAKNLVSKVWFNSGKLISEYFKEEEVKENLLEWYEADGIETGVKQGSTFEEYIETHNIWDRRIIKSQEEINIFGVKFIILSPDHTRLKLLLKKWEKELPENLGTGAIKGNDYHLSLNEHIKQDVFKEDESIHNGSSIAFILDCDSKKILLLGDAHPTSIVNGLSYFGYSKENPLKVDLVKVSHHGSKANTTYELLELIDCNSFVISSNGAVHNLPDKQCLARIINSKKNVILYFNYPNKIEEIFSDRDFVDYKFKALPIGTEFDL